MTAILKAFAFLIVAALICLAVMSLFPQGVTNPHDLFVIAQSAYGN